MPEALVSTFQTKSAGCLFNFRSLEKDAPSSGRYAMSDGEAVAWVNSENSKTRQLYASTYEDQLKSLKHELQLCRLSLKMLSTVDNVSQS